MQFCIMQAFGDESTLGILNIVFVLLYVIE